MALAPYYLQLTDGFGNSLPGATAEVRDTDNNLADLFTDEDGNTAASNPISPDSNGLVEFFVAPGQYTVTAQIGASTTQTVTIFVTGRDNGTANRIALGLGTAALSNTGTGSADVLTGAQLASENYVKFSGGSALQNTNGTPGASTPFPLNSGTWSPTVSGQDTAGDYSVSVTANTATFDIQGDIIELNALFSVTVNTAGSGRLLIGGIPQDTASGANGLGTVVTQGVDLPAGTVTTFISSRNVGGASELYLVAQIDDASQVIIPVTSLSTGDIIRLWIRYRYQ